MKAQNSFIKVDSEKIIISQINDLIKYHNENQKKIDALKKQNGGFLKKIKALQNELENVQK